MKFILSSLLADMTCICLITEQEEILDITAVDSPHLEVVGFALNNTAINAWGINLCA